MRLPPARSALCVALALVAAVTAGSAAAAQPSAGAPPSEAAGAASYVSYAEDPSVFPNPERGFYHRVEVVGLTSADVATARGQGITVLHSYIHLDAFRTSSISSSFLDDLAAGLDVARAGGVKIILRVAYNMGPYPDSEPDASESRIATHLAQLRPVFAEHSDVISSFEAGFVGAWGEWHTSTHGYDLDPDAKNRILKNILAAFPADRQVALRYPSDVRQQLPMLTAAEGDRIGNHQDCYGASDPDDWGTWGRDGTPVAEDKAFIGQVGEQHVIGGETCNVDSPRAHCPTALEEMPMMHFSYLNIDYEPNVIQNYRDEGCFDTLQRNLGYRFRLLDADLPDTVQPGGQLDLRIDLRNDGWAAPYNRRPVFAVLDGASGTFAVPVPVDPRSWAAGDDVTIDQAVTVPSGVPTGDYRLSLWLPDQDSDLRSNPAYSVRFANAGTWDPATGYNVLTDRVTVRAGSNSSASYEAEASANVLQGGATTAACGPCSGGSKVGYLGSGGVLTFAGVDGGTGGARQVTIHYTTAERRSATVAVNGAGAQTVSFASTGGWDAVGSLAVPVTLAAGTNTLRIANPAGWAPDVDRIVVSGS